MRQDVQSGISAAPAESSIRQAEISCLLLAFHLSKLRGENHARILESLSTFIRRQQRIEQSDGLLEIVGEAHRKMPIWKEASDSSGRPSEGLRRLVNAAHYLLSEYMVIGLDPENDLITDNLVSEGGAAETAKEELERLARDAGIRLEFYEKE